MIDSSRGEIMTERTKRIDAGVLSIVSGYLIWGCLPFYWKQLDHVGSLELLGHRVLWSAVFTLGYLFISRRSPLKRIREVFRTRHFLLLTGSAFFLAVNWLSYVYAITSGHLLEASKGYFIAPLTTVLFAMILFRERMGTLRAVSLLVSAVGVIYSTLQIGRFPYLAVTIAISFSLYTMFKKKIALDGLTSLMVDSLLLSPVALTYLIIISAGGSGSFAFSDQRTALFLAGSGIATLIPLALYISGAIAISATSVGFLQFITPIMAFLIGLLVYREPFTIAQGGVFAFILTGAVLYIVSLRKGRRKPVGLS